MSNLRLSLRTKLLGLAGVLLAFMAIIAITGIQSLSSVDDHAEDMYVNSTQPLEQLGIARAKANENRALLNNHLLNNHTDGLSAAGQKEIEDQIAANDATVEESLAKVEPTLQTAKGKAAFASIESNLAGYRQLRGRILELSDRVRPGMGAERIDALVQEAVELNLTQAVPTFKKAAAGFDQLFDSKVALAEAEHHNVQAVYASKRTLAIVLLVLALALGIAASLWIARGITRTVDVVLERLSMLRDHCITGLNNAVSAMAHGDLTVEVIPVTPEIEKAPADEIGDVARAVNDIRERTIATVGSYNEARDSLRELIGQTAATAQTLSAASQQMATTSEEAGRAVGEIATAVGDVAQGAERQVRMVDSAKRATEEMVSSTQSSAQNAQQTAEVAQQAREVAEQGAGAVAQASEAMGAVRDSSLRATEAIRDLGSKSEQIGGIVETITGIAEQTNLLALNAAIEAARAGEQGRGFAVVAEEVRKLAEESQQAAASIASLITEIQAETGKAVEVVEDGARRTEDGVQTVEQARESFLQISESVQDMNSRVEQIAAAIQQIAAGSSQMQQDMTEVAAVAEESSASTEQVSASTQQTSASTEQIAASAQELARNAEELDRVVGRFTLASEA